MFNGKTADEIIKYELEQKDASSYIIAAKKLKEEQPVYSLLFIVKYFVFSDKYFNNNGDLCDVLTYLEKFEKTYIWLQFMIFMLQLIEIGMN